MNRRWTPAVLLLVVLGLGAFYFARLAEGPRGGGRAPERTAETPAPGREEPAPLRPAPAAEMPGSVDATERASLAPETAPSAAPASDEPTRLVELVEAGSGKPVADAEVWYRSWQDGWNPLAFDRLAGSADTRRGRADAQGRVRIPWPAQETVLVMARKDALCGAAPVPPPHSPTEVARVELHSDWGVALEVVEADGKPAPRVPVALTLRREGWNAVENQLTDAAGRAAFAHIGLQFAQEAPRSLVVGVALPLAEPLERRLEKDTPPGEPVRFRLPPGGEVALTLLDRKSAPVPDETRVQLGLVWPGESRDVSPFGRDRQRMDQQAAGGKVRFEHVELGAEIELIVTRPNGGAGQREYFPGPLRAGERIERTVVVGQDATVLVFRALDEGRAPLADTELALELEQHTSTMSTKTEHTVHTDAEGRFEFELSDPYVEGDQRRLFVGAHDGELGASVDLARPFERGSVAMGDLVLAGAPVLLAGRVLDGAGAPLEGANVRLELSNSEGVEVAPSDEYFESTEIGARSAADGSFALRGFVSATRARAWAELPGRRSPVVEAPVGTQGLALTLRATGALAGSLLVDPFVPLMALELRVEREAPEGSASSNEDLSRQRIQPLSDGRFRWDSLLPGRYVVTVQSEQDADEFARVTGVEVRSGETCEDTRLQGLDLRGRLHAVTLVLQAPAGSGDLEGQFMFHKSGSASPERWHYVQGNRAELVTAWERIDGKLALRGFRAVDLEGLSGERVVELVPSLSVRLVLPSAVELPTPPVFVKAALTVDDSSIDWGAPVFDAAREIVVTAPGPGRLRVRWIVERRASGGASASTLEVEPVEFVEVEDGVGEQRFELAVTDEALKAALSKSRDL